jgi:NAD(P) transhydrogenase subunit beta
MTAMPQMVALFNGVGGGAVALIAWSEFRTTDAFAGEPLYVVIAFLFGADRRLRVVLGLARGVRQAPGDPARPPARVGPSTAGGEPAAAGRGRGLCGVGGDRRRGAVDGRAPRLRGRRSACMVVLPDRPAADMPVVISLLIASTGLSAAATGVALGNTAMIVAGMIVGASGAILTNLMATAVNRSIPAIVAGGFGGHRDGARRGRRRRTATSPPPRPPTRRSEWPTLRE